MRIHVYTGNHNNSSSIADTVRLLQHALRDCGHDARIAERIEPGELHLVIEHFVEERRLRELLDGHAAGARYILIGTEPIIGGSFNGGIEQAHWHYSNRDYWQLRFETFKIAAALAEAVWVLAEDMLPDYRALLPQRAVRFLPHGWASGFATVQQRPEAERDIDFHFSGSLTEHRRQILAALARDHRVVVHDQNTPEYLRQDQLSRAKVCLSLRLSPANRIPSVSRMHFHLQNRSFLLHEAYELGSPLDPFVLTARSEDLVPWALGALQLPNRREIAEHMHEQFKAALPMAALLSPLLDEVIAGLGAARALRAAA